MIAVRSNVAVGNTVDRASLRSGEPREGGGKKLFIFSTQVSVNFELPETIFELLISQDELGCESPKRSFHNFMEN